LIEPGQAAYSDVIRFEQDVVGPTGPVPGGFIYFFSELEPEEPNPDLADKGLPPPWTQFQIVTLDEQGIEGNNGAQYRPATAGLPGFVPQAPGAVLYTFLSDVPEPNTLAVLGLAGGLMVLFKRRQLARG